ncbi:MAG: hypothetical protein L0211_23405 [Planctomycetaceae bacterium]|nr:hypothetical protein [Planctomycetaceae bacterium]
MKNFLRENGACPVLLQTPYGIAKSPFMAVGRDHKLKNGKVVPGNVGHDRIQQAGGDQSIGEAIRHWYGIKAGRDFERIDLEVNIHVDPATNQSQFILVPTGVKLRDAKRSREVARIASPLSFHRNHYSTLWKQQIAQCSGASPNDVRWAADQIARVVADHAREDLGSVLESDLLRTAGALSLLGLNLSAYLGQGYDCIESQFQFLNLPVYPCPMEVKNRSRGFTYQIARYTNLTRAVVLCMEHNLVNPPHHIDVIELPALAEYLKKSA